LHFLLTAGYGITIPLLSAVIDNIKIKKLNKELNLINTEIEESKKEMQNIAKERRMKTLEFPFEPINLIESPKIQVLEHLEPHNCSNITVKTDNFDINKELVQRSETILNSHFSEEYNKEYTKKRKK